MLTVEGKQLEKAVKAAALGTVTGRKASRSPMLECVKVAGQGGRIWITGNGPDLHVTAKVTANTNGAALLAVVTARPFLNILKTVKGTVSLSREGEGLVIESGAARHVIEGWTVTDFVDPPVAVAEWQAVASAKDFVGALSKVIPAASDDDGRPGLETVMIEAEKGRLRFVTADGFRLAVAEIDGVFQEDHKVVIPVTAARAAVKMISGQAEKVVQLWITGEYKPFREDSDLDHPAQAVRIICGDVTLGTEGNRLSYPDYRAIIPMGSKFVAEIPKADFLQAVTEAKAVSDDRPVTLRFRFKAEKITVSIAGAVQSYSRDVKIDPLDNDQPDLLIGFNPGFLKDAIAAASGDTVQFTGISPNHPVTIAQADSPEGTYKSVIMPMYIPPPEDGGK